MPLLTIYHAPSSLVSLKWRAPRFDAPAIKKSAGFSLMELMIVVAIIGIIAAIALPGYADYVRRGKATEATSALAEQKIRMERYFQDNRTYLDTGGLVAPCSPPAGSMKFFTVTCTLQTATAFTLTATPNANVDMDGFEFTINESGMKTSKFQGNTGANCWLTSKSGTC